MAHPLYHPCRRALNRPVTLHLKSGRDYHGILHQVAHDGVHIRPISTVALEGEPANVETSDNPTRQEAEADNVFWPFFVPFSLLAGFTLGLAAGAIATRPYYGGYGYYW
ncbi:MAG: hypothetical protein WCC10_03310 [Tumebacillaceae bacterium]